MVKLKVDDSLNLIYQSIRIFFVARSPHYYFKVFAALLEERLKIFAETEINLELLIGKRTVDVWQVIFV